MLKRLIVVVGGDRRPGGAGPSPRSRRRQEHRRNRRRLEQFTTLVSLVKKAGPGRDAAPARPRTRSSRRPTPPSPRCRRRRSRCSRKQGDAETGPALPRASRQGPGEQGAEDQVGDHRRGRKGSVQRARQDRLRERIENHQNRHRMQQRDHPRDQRGADPAGSRIPERSGWAWLPSEPGGATRAVPAAGVRPRGWSELSSVAGRGEGRRGTRPSRRRPRQAVGRRRDGRGRGNGRGSRATRAG